MPPATGPKARAGTDRPPALAAGGLGACPTAFTGSTAALKPGYGGGLSLELKIRRGWTAIANRAGLQRPNLTSLAGTLPPGALAATAVANRPADRIRGRGVASLPGGVSSKIRLPLPPSANWRRIDAAPAAPACGRAISSALGG